MGDSFLVSGRNLFGVGHNILIEVVSDAAVWPCPVESFHAEPKKPNEMKLGSQYASYILSLKVLREMLRDKAMSCSMCAERMSFTETFLLISWNIWTL